MSLGTLNAITIAVRKRDSDYKAESSLCISLFKAPSLANLSASSLPSIPWWPLT